LGFFLGFFALAPNEHRTHQDHPGEHFHHNITVFCKLQQDEVMVLQSLQFFT